MFSTKLYKYVLLFIKKSLFLYVYIPHFFKFIQLTMTLKASFLKKTELNR